MIKTAIAGFAALGCVMVASSGSAWAASACTRTSMHIAYQGTYQNVYYCASACGCTCSIWVCPPGTPVGGPKISCQPDACQLWKPKPPPTARGS